MSAPDERVTKSDPVGPHVRVTVIDVMGSAPREVGASMRVTPFGAAGTIGGGRLEFEATEEARCLLSDPAYRDVRWLRRVQEYPLGPRLGQCCGGMVTLLYERFLNDELAAMRHAESEAPRIVGLPGGVSVRSTVSGSPPIVVRGRTVRADLPTQVLQIARDMERGVAPRVLTTVTAADGVTHVIEPVDVEPTVVCVYGAGHVGRAVVNALAPLDFALTWFDVDVARFPDQRDRRLDRNCSIARVASDDLVGCAKSAPPGAFHIVMTFSHTLDEALVRALIERSDAAYVGMIGSKTKAARFRQRFRADGFSEAAIGRLVCPIGLPGLGGKAPAVIAASVAADLLIRRQATVVDAGTAETQKRSRPGT